MTILKAEHISYSYRTKYQTIEAVRDVSCKFDAGKMYAVTGESGSGKSTLLSMLAGLDLPQSGRIYVQGKDLAAMDRDRYRREQASVVYQAFHLFPLLTALENVMFPLELKKVKKKAAAEQAKELIINAQDVLEYGSVEEKRTLIHALIKRIDVDGEDIYITWRFL